MKKITKQQYEKLTENGKKIVLAAYDGQLPWEESDETVNLAKDEVPQKKTSNITKQEFSKLSNETQEYLRSVIGIFPWELGKPDKKSKVSNPYNPNEIELDKYDESLREQIINTINVIESSRTFAADDEVLLTNKRTKKAKKVKLKTLLDDEDETKSQFKVAFKNRVKEKVPGVQILVDAMKKKQQKEDKARHEQIRSEEQQAEQLNNQNVQFGDLIGAQETTTSLLQQLLAEIKSKSNSGIDIPSLPGRQRPKPNARPGAGRVGVVLGAAAAGAAVAGAAAYTMRPSATSNNAASAISNDYADRMLRYDANKILFKAKEIDFGDNPPRVSNTATPVPLNSGSTPQPSIPSIPPAQTHNHITQQATPVPSTSSGVPQLLINSAQTHNHITQQATPVPSTPNRASFSAPQGSSLGGAGTSNNTANGLSFLPGVDPRINSGIAEKIKALQPEFRGLSVSSGYRDPSRNASVGGARNSAHMRANAVDVRFQGTAEDTNRFILEASKKGIGGIGVYGPGNVHLDTESKRVWGPDFSQRSIPQWAQAAMQSHMTGSAGQQTSNTATATPSATQPTSAPTATPSATPARSLESTNLSRRDATPQSSEPSMASSGFETSDSVQVASAPSSTATRGVATPVESPPSSGSTLNAASASNEIAIRTPEAPSIPQPPAITEPSSSGGGMSGPTYNVDPNDPGNVEPLDATERFARLFEMAA